MNLGVSLRLPFNNLAEAEVPPAAWPPVSPHGDTALVAADFTGSRYWANGAATNLAGVLAENTSWGTWNPSNVTADGLNLLASNARPSLVETVFDTLPSQVTIVYYCEIDPQVGSGTFHVEVDMVEVSGFAADAQGAINYVATEQINGTFQSLAIGTVSGTPISLRSPIGCAFTVYTDHVAGSFCGENTVSTVVGIPSVSPDLIGIEGSGIRPIWMTYFAIFAVQPDNTLPLLSSPG